MSHPPPSLSALLSTLVAAFSARSCCRNCALTSSSLRLFRHRNTCCCQLHSHQDPSHYTSKTWLCSASLASVQLQSCAAFTAPCIMTCTRQYGLHTSHLRQMSIQPDVQAHSATATKQGKICADYSQETGTSKSLRAPKSMQHKHSDTPSLHVLFSKTRSSSFHAANLNSVRHHALPAHVTTSVIVATWTATV